MSIFRLVNLAAGYSIGIALLLSVAREQILHSDYVVIGSISVIASSLNHKIAPRMLMSNDFDCFPINDQVAPMIS